MAGRALVVELASVRGHGFRLGEAAARGEIFEQLTHLLGADAALTINSLVQQANRPDAGIVGTLVGLGTLLIGATTVFAELRNAMDRIWRTKDLRPHGGGLMELLHARLISLGLVLAIGFLLMVSLVLSAALAGLSKWATPWLGQLAVLAGVWEFPLRVKCAALAWHTLRAALKGDAAASTE